MRFRSTRSDSEVDFVGALRRKGIPVGPSEAVDAASAMVHVDLLDRAALREALAATILHKPTHRGVFDQLFDLWFPAAVGAHASPDAVALEVEIPTDDDGKVDPEALNALIASLLLEDTEESRAAARALAELLVEQLGSYDSVNGQRFSAYQARSPLDTSAIMQKILDGLMGADPFDPDGQFIDRGHSYTLAVYFLNDSQRTSALEAISLLERQSGRKVYISVEPFRSFFPAEEYHQDFYRKHPEEFRQELISSGRIKE